MAEIDYVTGVMGWDSLSRIRIQPAAAAAALRSPRNRKQDSFKQETGAVLSPVFFLSDASDSGSE